MTDRPTLIRTFEGAGMESAAAERIATQSTTMSPPFAALTK
jgi:hypothetical protein